MHNWDDDYARAWNEGGASAANELLTRKFPKNDAQIAELRRLEDTGRWDISWYPSSTEDNKIEFGIIRAFRLP